MAAVAKRREKQATCVEYLMNKGRKNNARSYMSGSEKRHEQRKSQLHLHIGLRFYNPPLLHNPPPPNDAILPSHLWLKTLALLSDWRGPNKDECLSMLPDPCCYGCKLSSPMPSSDFQREVFLSTHRLKVSYEALVSQGN